MMSELQVQVATVSRIDPHPNADRLELAQVLGWQTVVPKGQYQAGDTVVYFPPDTMLPEKTSDRFGVTAYLSKGGRIKAIRLRGERSFGLVVTPDNTRWEVGRDVAEHYGATKYEPPVHEKSQRKIGPGRESEYSLPEHPRFPVYTPPEHLQNFPSLLSADSRVVLTEKVHGRNTRVGIINGEWMIGSHKVRRRLPFLGWQEWVYQRLKHLTYLPHLWRITQPLLAFSVMLFTSMQRQNPHAFDDFVWSTGREDEMEYWYPLSLPSVRALLTTLAKTHTQVILYGEIYGKGMQWMEYGRDGLDYCAFDLLIDGTFCNWAQYQGYCAIFSVPIAPVIAHVPYDLELVREQASGKTTLMKGEGTHLREGVVLRPVEEQTHPRVGRVLFKYLNDEYLIKNVDKDLRDI